MFGRNVERLNDQVFLGQPCTYGDDRHLTNLALADGWRVVLAPEALSSTLVPERFGHWVRQQTRWSKSFVRESGWALLRTSGAPFVLSFVELVSWILLTSVILFSLGFSVVTLTLGGDPGAAALVVGLYGVWVVLSSLARSARYLDVARPGMSLVDRVKMLALSPVYGVLHICVLLPLRFWALLTMKDSSWGTRSEGVEVEL